jgi:hypothetical protein
MRTYFEDASKATKSWYYNGFNPEQRRASNIPQRNARRKNEPDKCCITGFSDPSDLKGRGYLFLHLEDYNQPTEWLPCSKMTHTVLHNRFIKPDEWFNLVGRNYRHGAWFTMITMAPKKMFNDYWLTYPIGLPQAHELWADVADQLELSADFFLNAPTKEVIRRLWKWDERIVFSGKVTKDLFMEQKAVQPVATNFSRIRQVGASQLGLPLSVTTTA